MTDDEETTPKWMRDARVRHRREEEREALDALAPGAPMQGPALPPGYLVTRGERLVAAAAELEAQQSAADTAQILADLSSVGERMVAAFAGLPCRGEVARAGECSDAFAAGCEWRDSRACPRQMAAHERDQQREIERQRLTDAGVPSDAVRILMGRKFEVREAVAVVEEFLASDRRTLIIAGDNLIGKTVAGGHAIRSRGGLFIVPRQLRRLAGAGWEKDARELEDRIHAAPMLVVDDVGMEYLDPQGKMLAIMTGIIVERHNDALRTILTTNLDERDFAKRYPDRRVFARIKLGGWWRNIGGRQPARGRKGNDGT